MMDRKAPDIFEPYRVSGKMPDATALNLDVVLPLVPFVPVNIHAVNPGADPPPVDGNSFQMGAVGMRHVKATAFIVMAHDENRAVKPVKRAPVPSVCSHHGNPSGNHQFSHIPSAGGHCYNATDRAGCIHRRLKRRSVVCLRRGLCAEILILWGIRKKKTKAKEKSKPGNHTGF